MKPTFIGIGAQKCASTWLYRILADHPEVTVSPQKEVDFFSYRFDHGYRWYEARFDGCERRRMIGEISPSYFCEPAVPARVRRYLPDARILVSVRDPVVRALSNHRHEVRVGHLASEDLSFESGLANNPMYIEQGRYATHLKRWLEHFPREQILVVFMEDIERDPLQVARAVYAFLGIDGDHPPSKPADRANRSYAVRNRTLSGIKDLIYERTRGPALHWLWTLGAAAGLREVYRGINVIPSDRLIPPPKGETLAALRAVFEPEVRELSELTGRPLDGWLRS